MYRIDRGGFYSRLGKIESEDFGILSRLVYFSSAILGVPIPVFYDEDGEPLLDQIYFFIAMIEKEGTDLWFSHSASELLNGYKLPEEWEGSTTKGNRHWMFGLIRVVAIVGIESSKWIEMASRFIPRG